MEDLIFIVWMIGFVSCLGTFVYSIVGSFYMLSRWDGRLKSGMHADKLLPIRLRRFGHRCMMVFVVCFMLIIMLQLFRRS